MNDEQEPWWTRPPEPQPETGEPTGPLTHPGLKLGTASQPATEPPPEAAPEAEAVAGAEAEAAPEPAAAAPAGPDAQPVPLTQPEQVTPPEPVAPPGAVPERPAMRRAGGILSPVTGRQYTVPPERAPRETPDGDPRQARTQQLPAAADGIFATFSGADPRPVITGPIPAQSQPWTAARPGSYTPESYTPGSAVPGYPGGAGSATGPPVLLDSLAASQAGAQQRTAGGRGWGSGSPRRVLIAVAAVLGVATVVLVAVINGGGGRRPAPPGNRPATPATAAAVAAAADFGGAPPRGLARVGSAEAASLLRKAGQLSAGTIVEAWTWKDRNGTNLVVSTRTVEPGQHQSLKVIHVARLETDTPDVLRIMTDPKLPACPAGGTAGFTTNSLLVRDLNGDGVAEIAAGWSSHCKDAKASEVRLALITNGDKYIVRGKGVIGGKSGSAVPDPKVSSWPAGFAPALQKLFSRLYY